MVRVLDDSLLCTAFHCYWGIQKLTINDRFWTVHTTNTRLIECLSRFLCEIIPGRRMVVFKDSLTKQALTTKQRYSLRNNCEVEDCYLSNYRPVFKFRWLE